MLLHRKIILVLFITIFSSAFYAQERGLGLGIILGEPTGISGKLWLDKDKAIDFGLAYSLADSHESFSIHIDNLYHVNDLIDALYLMPVYYGFGARFRVGDKRDDSFGVRGVIGVLLYLDEAPVDFFFEIAPVFKLLPETALGLDIGLGGRYYFN